MVLTTSTWQLSASSIQHKRDLLDYAEKCGVKVANRLLGYHEDSDLFISWLSDGIGLGSLPKRHESRPTQFVTTGEFLNACEQHRLNPHP